MAALNSSLVQVLSTAALTDCKPREIDRSSGYCNERLEFRFDSGPALIVKRARFDWVAERMRASRQAAALLRRRTGVIAPAHLDVERDARGRAVEAYWRIPQPTLAELWPNIPEKRRPQALRSWGELLRRVHKVKLSAAGTLHGSRGAADLAAHLASDLQDRLLPALADTWPSAVPTAESLLREVDEVHARSRTRPTVLLHNDFHMGNVLCERRPRSIRCVGVIDLETAWAGPAESDVALVRMLHGPLFGQELPAGWNSHFLKGYGAELDPIVLRFFYHMHMLNHGYFAATCGWDEHVRDIEAAMGGRVAFEVPASKAFASASPSTSHVHPTSTAARV